MKPQHIRALDAANRTMSRACAERRRLVHAPPHILVPAIVNPKPEFAAYRIGTLFAGGTGGGVTRRLICGCGPIGLRQVFARLEAERPAGRVWTPDVRLRDLTISERRRLIRALLELPTVRSKPPVAVAA